VTGVGADALIFGLDVNGICATSNSACASGQTHLSHVLAAMGLADDLARGALRFSLGRASRTEDVQWLLAVLPGLVDRLRRAETGHH
jgi:cysteine desulfurase